MPKNILITGAAGNLGSAVAKVLLDEGYKVIGTMEPGHKQPDNGVDFFECDLTDEIETGMLFDHLKEKYKTIHGAVLLVGGFGMGSIENATGHDMMEMFKLNYMTAYYAAQNAFKWMKQSHGGRIILVGAKPALEGGAAPVLPYAVSKSAVIKLGEILDEAGADHNIRASVIAPSVIDTPPNRKHMKDANFEDWVKPEEIAEAISFLIGNKSKTLRDTVLKLYNNA